MPGEAVTAGFAFDVPVRFDTDRLEIDLASFEAGEIPRSRSSRSCPEEPAMRSIDPGLAAELASGATTLCRCWRALRRDGRRFGFTDHDRDLAFDGTLFQASTGLEASEAESLLGLAVGAGRWRGR